MGAPGLQEHALASGCRPPAPRRRTERSGQRSIAATNDGVVPSLSHPRLPMSAAHYAPSWVEWSLLAGFIAYRVREPGLRRDAVGEFPGLCGGLGFLDLG